MAALATAALSLTTKGHSTETILDGLLPGGHCSGEWTQVRSSSARAQLLDDDRERAAWRGGQRYVHRFVHAPLSAAGAAGRKTDMKRKSWWQRREGSDAL